MFVADCLSRAYLDDATSEEIEDVNVVSQQAVTTERLMKTRAATEKDNLLTEV